MNKILKDQIINDYINNNNKEDYNDDFIDIFNKLKINIQKLEERKKYEQIENNIKKKMRKHFKDEDINKKNELEYLLNKFKVTGYKNECSENNIILKLYNADIYLPNSKKIYLEEYSSYDRYDTEFELSCTIYSSDYSIMWKYISNEDIDYEYYDKPFDNFPYNSDDYQYNCKFKKEFKKCGTIDKIINSNNKELGLKYLSYLDIKYFFKSCYK